MAYSKPNISTDAQLYELECISHALKEFEKVEPEQVESHMLSGFGDRLSKIHAHFKAKLLG